MCGRFTQQRSSSELAAIFDADDRIDEPGGRFNVAPTDPAAVIVQRDDGRALTAYRWGLIPHWSESPATGNKMFNARAESIDRTPAFRYAFQKRRCLVPVDAFYEWRREGTVRQPFAVQRRDGQPMALAGLWAGWHDDDTGEVIRSFTIVTTGPNELMRPIHDRMPVVVPESAWDLWLDPTITSAPALAELKGLLVPAADDWLDAYRVGRQVNNVRNDGPSLVEPLAEGAEAFGSPARDAATGPAGRRQKAAPGQLTLEASPDAEPTRD